MNSADLKFFVAVARTKGMNRAATELNTVQSNVTARIRALEAELGLALFDRHSRGVALTPAGRRLLPFAQRVGQLLVEAKRAAGDDGMPAGPLEVGTLETTAAMRLAPVLTAFVKAYPNVDLSLRTGTTADLVDDVIERRVEGAFVCAPVRHPELVTESIYVEELVLLTEKRYPTLKAALQSEKLRIVVLKRGCSYRQRLEDLLHERGLPAPRLLEFGTLEAIFSAVAADLGITLLPRAVMDRVSGDHAINVHELPNRSGHAETVFIRRADAYVSSAQRAFLAFVAGTSAKQVRAQSVRFRHHSAHARKIREW